MNYIFLLSLTTKKFTQIYHSIFKIICRNLCCPFLCTELSPGLILFSYPHSSPLSGSFIYFYPLACCTFLSATINLFLNLFKFNTEFKFIHSCSSQQIFINFYYVLATGDKVMNKTVPPIMELAHI